MDFNSTAPQSNGYSGGFGAQSCSGRRVQEGSPYGSARAKQQQCGGSSRLSAAAAHSFSPASSGGNYFDSAGPAAARTGSGNGNGVTFLSPAPSARSGGNGSARMTPNERRAYLERSAEINAVRSLQQ